MDEGKQPRRAVTGRPSKKTDGAVQRIIELLAAGNYRRVAFTAAGISQETFSRWMREDHVFREAVIKAEGDADALHLANIQRAAIDGTWQASAWYLERKHPEEWGKQDRRPEGSERVEITLRWDDTPEAEA
jgi:transposase